MRRLFCLLVFSGLMLPLCAQEVEAGLYRPSSAALVLNYPPAHMEKHVPLKPIFHLYGRGFPAGKAVLSYGLFAGNKKLHHGRWEFEADGSVFEHSIELDSSFPEADRVTWRYEGNGDVKQGDAPLRWSRFHGRLEYTDGQRRPSYISLHPHSFGGGEFLVPVGDDGQFDTRLPARSYAIVNVNGGGYAVDSMERWAWHFDISKDREETFRIGRTELYSMNVFRVIGGSGTTLFVSFRPSALTRILQHTVGPVAKAKDKASLALTGEHLKRDPMAIAPDLRKKDVKVWLDGEPQTVSDLNRLVETQFQGYNQTQYILQITSGKPLKRGFHHEVKVEVESSDVLNGKLITDFGQGSVGLFIE